MAYDMSSVKPEQPLQHRYRFAMAAELADWRAALVAGDELVLTRDQAADLVEHLAQVLDDTEPVAEGGFAMRCDRVAVGIQQINDRAGRLNAVLRVAEHELRWTKRILTRVTR